MSRPDPSRIVAEALDVFRIELPSWGFANTGTRFGKYLQPAAAGTIEEKCQDAGQVHALTGACPTVAMHVQWDFPRGVADVDAVRAAARAAGTTIPLHQAVLAEQAIIDGSYDIRWLESFVADFVKKTKS